MAPGTLTLIGSGETSEALLNVYAGLFQRAAAARPGGGVRLAFLNTPAGFQLNTGEIESAFNAYFKKHFNLDISVADYRGRGLPADPAPAIAALSSADVILAGPGSPTYAAEHWRGSPVWAAAVARWGAGAHLVMASSAAIALSRYALPVYEIYKAGRPAHWTDGLDLLEPLGLDLAILPHYDNKEGRSYDTRYCFMGEPRLKTLETLLPASAVIAGVDENTAVTLDFAAGTAAVAGLGGLSLRHSGREVRYPAGASLPLDRLTAGLAATPYTPPAKAGAGAGPAPAAVPAQVLAWAAERDRMRAERKFAEGDALRARIGRTGYSLKDSPAGPVFSLTRLASPSAVASSLEAPDAADWSLNLLARNNAGEVLRAARSALAWGGPGLEVVIVDNGSDDGTAEAIAGLAAEDERVRPVLLAADAGEGAGRNAGLRASRGAGVILLGGHMEIAGDIFAPLAAALADPAVGAAGSNGLVSEDLFNFNPAPTPECDALEFYLFAFRRARLAQVGLLDEKFHFYRNLDLDWSLAFRDKGLRLVALAGLPLSVHQHPYLRMDPAERDKLSRKNYRRFLDKWRERRDLLLASHAG